MKFFIRCYSLEENTYAVEANTNMAAIKLFYEGKADYVEGSNKILSEDFQDVWQEGEKV